MLNGGDEEAQNKKVHSIQLVPFFVLLFAFDKGKQHVKWMGENVDPYLSMKTSIQAFRAEQCRKGDQYMRLH